MPQKPGDCLGYHAVKKVLQAHPMMHTTAPNTAKIYPDVDSASLEDLFMECRIQISEGETSKWS